MKRKVHSGEICFLNELKVGQKARVIYLYTRDKSKKRHLLDMGFTKGVKIKVSKVAPMGDPLTIELRDYELCISKDDLKEIQVEVI